MAMLDLSRAAQWRQAGRCFKDAGGWPESTSTISKAFPLPPRSFYQPLSLWSFGWSCWCCSLSCPGPLLLLSASTGYKSVDLGLALLSSVPPQPWTVCLLGCEAKDQVVGRAGPHRHLQALYYIPDRVRLIANRGVRQSTKPHSPRSVRCLRAFLM